MTDAIKIEEAARDLINAMREGQQHVGYRLDLWDALQGCLDAHPDTPKAGPDEEPVAFLYQTDTEEWLSRRDDEAPKADCDFKVIPLYPAVQKLAAMQEALRLFVGCAYPVSTEINQRGHNWSEAYLDEALVIARAAIAAMHTPPEAQTSAAGEERKAIVAYMRAEAGQLPERSKRDMLIMASDVEAGFHDGGVLS